MEEFFYKTAAFAQLAGLPKKTLLYYDVIGLFRPARVEQNGYRFYSIFQLDRLALIVALRDLGLSLKEIKNYLDSGDLARMDELLTRQRQAVEERMAQLQAQRVLLERLQRENAAFLRYTGQGPQRLHFSPERARTLMEAEEVRRHPFVIVNYLTDGAGTGARCEGEELLLFRRQEDGPLLLPGGEYLCLFESSPQPVRPWIQSTRRRLEEWAQAHGLRLAEESFLAFHELSVDVQKPHPQTQPLRMLRAKILEQGE